jgi:hypothetical protein
MTHDHEHDPELTEVSDRLRTSRAVPRPGFRGALRRRLLADDAPHAAPAGLRRVIAAYAGAGTVLVAIAAVGLAGVGPFGA